MDDSAKTIGTTTKAPQPNYLEQLAQEMVKQRELINILDERLGVVSERMPQEQTEPANDRVHVSTMVDILLTNGKLINWIVTL